ncbi:MAG: hypothetical protein JSW51_09525 [Gemmatimonadota bacterium]|nr:MAG: hypothetical protein JSW51_09525 [Gemmatimonadota bacterium]
MRSYLLFVAFMAVLPRLTVAQQWNNDSTMAIVNRAVERRATVRSDSGLRDYRSRAHGFVFFLGQLGELEEPPRLIKSDQLELEVYWKAPGIAKQRIIGWRNRADLPTDIRYHRDHLGIVINNFGDLIGLGHEEEVRNVPHPLSRDGLRLYDFALVDSQTIRTPQRVVQVYQVKVRPKDVEAQRVIGTLYIDVDQAELVRFRFNFTRNAYVDDTLEDITIVLENSLWDGRYWLPVRQEIEIRRRSSVLDLPARAIIRGRWEIDSYEFNTDIPDPIFRGPTIVAAPEAVRDTFQWEVSLDAAIREVSDPAMTFDLEEVRAEVRQLAQDQVLTGLATSKVGANSISQLVRFNRVEGLALGLGWIFRPGGGAVRLYAWGSYGFSSRRFRGRVELSRRFGRITLGLRGSAVTQDVGDIMVISPALNSILAQEVANDYGDYFFLKRGTLLAELEVGTRSTLKMEVGAENTSNMQVQATPATGQYRANPELGSGSYGVGSLGFELRSSGFVHGKGVSGSITVEGGVGDETSYARVYGQGKGLFSVGATDLVLNLWAGAGTRELPAHRSFVMGGRGTLIPDPFRQWGGRQAVLGGLEWRIQVPFPAVPLGPYTSTDNRITLAPTLAAGWTGGTLVQAVPWQSSGNVRPVIGLGLEWFHNLFRVDLAFSLRDTHFGIVFDVNRDLWSIL